MPVSGSTYNVLLTMSLISVFTALAFVFFIASSMATLEQNFVSAVDPRDVGTVIYTTPATNIAVEIDFYAGGVIRFRARPQQGKVYQVMDVVVGKKLPGPTKGKAEGATISSAPAGTFICGETEAGDKDYTICYVTSPCGTSSLKIAVLDNREFEFSYSSAKFGVLSVGKVTARPEGPMGEFTFPQANALYGIPERAVDLALKAGQSYRLWNLDVFKYELDNTKGVYGTIPFLMAHSLSGGGSAPVYNADGTPAPAKATSAILWLNSGDTTVNVGEASGNTNNGGGWQTKWTSEQGLPDVFFFPGPTPMDVQKQHAALVGPSLMPPLFSLGYHQCRWNYRSEEDTLEVDHGFEVHDIPYDVLWLDIEHTDGKRYFTWDKYNFPNPKSMIEKVASKGRKMVTITDPHIKRDDNYHVHKEATAKRFYVQTEAGADFEGHCWPGQSSWVDFYNAEARKWYATLFHYDRYPGSTPDLYSWIDMNEPSVFNAHEVTMDKKAQHQTAGGTKYDHGAVHNMYGYYHTMAAYDGHILRNSVAPYIQKRPFILTRSFFSGSQRYAAMWTGDNMARWDHLEKSIPMLLALSLSNYIFVGADVGGFFDNPDAQLSTRWYQAGAFYPFYRGHAHLETKRREPWLFGEETTKRIRDAIILRYSLLPYTYTQFFLAHDEGSLVMRPLFFEFPVWKDEQRAFMVGPALLARPVTQENAQDVEVPLPAAAAWYEYPSGKPATAGTIPVTMDSIPAYLRAGHIMPTRQRVRRSTSAMINDPLTLFVAVGSANVPAAATATGLFYHDDGTTFDYKESGKFLLAQFKYDGKTFTSTPLDKAPGTKTPASAEFAAKNTHIIVEKIVFCFPTAEEAANHLKVGGGSGGVVNTEDVEVEQAGNVVTVSRLNLSVADKFEFTL